MSVPVVEFSQLDYMLDRTPVIADVHSLVPLGLSPGTLIVTDSHDFQVSLDNRKTEIRDRILILDHNEILRGRFPHVLVPSPPSSAGINQNIRYHLDYVRAKMLTNRRIASHIEYDVNQYRYDVVILLLIDGLSYGDIAHWGGHVKPCFVDGVSVTFQFDESDVLLRSVGFAAILNQPSVFVRLYRHNYHHSLGFTYWQSGQNRVSEYLFQGIPLVQVENFQTVHEILDKSEILPNTYIQIMREGLDGMAHGKRELHPVEISGAITAIEKDVDNLKRILHQRGLRSVIYITSDHGILWKTHHDFLAIDIGKSKARYSLNRPDIKFMDYVVRFEHENIPYYLFTYPYIGAKIRSNDSGLHGGLSYQESVVPFVKIEVN
jgi:hypothetical protein